jgi:hypothetical protein
MRAHKIGVLIARVFGPERMMRSLSVSLYTNGQSRFQNKPSDWEYVSPKGNGATLLKLLCQNAR